MMLCNIEVPGVTWPIYFTDCLRHNLAAKCRIPRPVSSLWLYLTSRVTKLMTAKDFPRSQGLSFGDFDQYTTELNFYILSVDCGESSLKII